MFYTVGFCLQLFCYFPHTIFEPIVEYYSNIWNYYNLYNYFTMLLYNVNNASYARKIIAIQKNIK